VTVPIDQHTGTVPIDCIIVRGCSVTAKAQHECEKEIARLKRKFPKAEIIPTGCLPGATKAIDALNAPKALKTQNTLAAYDHKSRAHIKIQDGCNGHCAFCIVPQFRGPPISLPFPAILDRARAFLDAGFRELVITGCNLALYRDSGHGLADLLAALADLPPPAGCEDELATSPGTIHRVRLGSIEPGICDTRIFDCLAAHPNICRSLHISLQSGSNHILQQMNRPYAAEAVAAFCQRLRREVSPQFAFGADVIAGFPGETEADHAATVRFLEQQTDGLPLFSNLHVFPYSERPGTPAATMSGTVPHALRQARARELQAIGQHNRAIFAESFIGRTVVVCVEKDGNGWTDEYLRATPPPGGTRRRLVAFRVQSVAGQDNHALIFR
jgi:threonylcarbamoyladenosine tRNA methylthiotransferase MtaB